MMEEASDGGHSNSDRDWVINYGALFSKLSEVNPLNILRHPFLKECYNLLQEVGLKALIAYYYRTIN